MHTRGLPTEMMSRATYDNLRAAVCDELSACINAAQAAGLPPWWLIADPGIGFAKQFAHNLQILHDLPAYVAHFSAAHAGRTAATLVGASRKGFIGKVLDQPDALKRQWGNAATVSAAVVGGADIVRVHEVDEMRQVACMSDAIHMGHGGSAGEAAGDAGGRGGDRDAGGTAGILCDGSAAKGGAQASESSLPPLPARRDTIELGAISFEAIVGIREREQRTMQPLLVDMRMDLRVGIDGCARTGDLDGSVNYSATAKQVVFIGQHGQWGLLESYGLALCRLLLLDPAPHVRCHAASSSALSPPSHKHRHAPHQTHAPPAATVAEPTEPRRLPSCCCHPRRRGARPCRPSMSRCASQRPSTVSQCPRYT